MKKPREFWIRDNEKHYGAHDQSVKFATFDCNEYEKDEIENPDYRVIEKSAYDKAVEALKECLWLKEACIKIMSGYEPSFVLEKDVNQWRSFIEIDKTLKELGEIE